MPSERKKIKSFRERQDEVRERREAKIQARLEANLPDPFLQRKIAIFLALVFIIYATYAYIARICVPMIQRSIHATGSRTEGIILLVFFLLLFVMVAWSYAMILHTPPGYAKDHVEQSLSPPFESHYWENPTLEHQHQEDPDEEAAQVQQDNAGLTSVLPQAASLPGTDSQPSQSGLEQTLAVPFPQQQENRHPRPSPAAVYAAVASQPNPRRIPSRVPKLQEYYRWCTRCERLKPYRTHHCRHCGTCVLKMDHHCPWVGQCVGARNYKFYNNFIQWCGLWTLYVFFGALFAIIPVNKPSFATYKVDPQLIVLLAIAVLFSFFTIGLTVGHLYLLFSNVSTIEDIAASRQRNLERQALTDHFGMCAFIEHWRTRQRWQQEWGAPRGEANPWSLGSAMANWQMVMGRAKWRWFLPVAADHTDSGLKYVLNPRFTADGIQLPRNLWPAELHVHTLISLRYFERRLKPDHSLDLWQMRVALTVLILLFRLCNAAQQVSFDSETSIREENWHDVFGSGFSPEDYHGIVTLFGVEPVRCFGKDADRPFDIAILGAPFDTATSFRPGARFGPNAIRQGSRRIQRSGFSYNVPLRADPLKGSSALTIDCGDVPMSLYSNELALSQLQKAYGSLLRRKTVKAAARSHPRMITLGGDHSIILPILRELHSIYGPVAIIHFDSHLDSWRPSRLFGGNGRLPEAQLPITHGSMLWVAAHEGLIANGSSVHVGIRTPLLDMVDYETDEHCGFSIIEAEEIEDIGYKGVVARIKDVVGTQPVYVSIDIDTIDPSMAPATGTPEIGGLTTREMKKILHALDGLKIVGVDIVEVSPDYDSQDAMTSITAANLAWESMLLKICSILG